MSNETAPALELAEVSSPVESRISRLAMSSAPNSITPEFLGGILADINSKASSNSGSVSPATSQQIKSLLSKHGF